MGLMDRDYPNEKRRESPFSPPPARPGTSTLGKVFIFLAILFALYKLADWKLQQRTENLGNTQSREKAAQPLTKSPATQAFPPRPEQQNTPDATAGSQTVIKCVVNGKTSYGDGPCAQGAAGSQVKIRSNHNLMAAVRPQTITAQTEERIAPDIVVVQTNPTTNIAAAKKAECQLLNAEIKQLDAMSRQPQGPQTLDWIRDERKKVRDQQFRLSCP